MKNEDIEALTNQLEDFNSLKSSNQLIKASISSALPNFKSNKLKNEIIKFLIAALFSCGFSFFLATSTKTITKFDNILEIINNLEVALLGITFTGFALFQAILSNKLIQTLLCQKTNDSKSSNLFVKVNNSFYYLIVLYVIGIFINIVLLLFLKIVDSSWVLFPDNLLLNELICGILLFAYFYFNFFVLLELKYFLFNLFRLFNTSIVSKVYEILENEVEKNK